MSHLVPGTGGVAQFPCLQSSKILLNAKKKNPHGATSNQRYRVMIETASDAVVCIDEVAGQSCLQNPATTKVFWL